MKADFFGSLLFFIFARRLPFLQSNRNVVGERAHAVLLEERLIVVFEVRLRVEMPFGFGENLLFFRVTLRVEMPSL